MPTYNKAVYIGQAIESVLRQTHENLELIVVDNFSSDDTADVVAAFRDERVRYLTFHNRGIIAAGRNHGVAHARGEVLAFLDSDDEWVSNKLQQQLQHLRDDSIVCVGSDFTPIGESQRCSKAIAFRKSETYRDLSYADLLLENPMATSSAMMRTQLFRECKGFDESPELAFIEDWELWLRVARRGVVRLLREPLIRYRIVRDKGRDEVDRQLRTVRIVQRHQEMGWMDDRLFHSALGNRFVGVGRAYLEQDDRTGVGYYWRALWLCRGVQNRLLTLFGLVLFSFPKPLRRKVLATYKRHPIPIPGAARSAMPRKESVSGFLR